MGAPFLSWSSYVVGIKVRRRPTPRFKRSANGGAVASNAGLGPAPRTRGVCPLAAHARLTPCPLGRERCLPRPWFAEHLARTGLGRHAPRRGGTLTVVSGRGQRERAQGVAPCCHGATTIEGLGRPSSAAAATTRAAIVERTGLA